MPLYVLCLVLILCFTPLHATNPIADSTAPNFTITSWIQAPAGTTTHLEGLRGKIVILDFWATWCGSCRPALKKLNVLSEKFSGKPIVFMALSNEKESIIKKYLQSNPTTLWMGIDSSSLAFQRYNVRVIPHTVIIDKAGKLIATTQSDEITEDRINDLLAGKHVVFKKPLLLTADDIIKKELANLDTNALPSIVFSTVSIGYGHDEVSSTS